MKESHEKKYPLIPLREVVLFPNTLLPLLIARPFSLSAARHALSMDSLALFVSQRSAEVEQPEQKDLYRFGTVGKFLQHVTPPDGSIRAVVQGIERVRVESLVFEDGYYQAVVRPTPRLRGQDEIEDNLARMVREYLQDYLKYTQIIPEEVSLSMLDLRADHTQLADLLSAHLPIDADEKQKLLESSSLRKHLDELVRILIRELDFIEVRQDIESRVKDELKKGQRQYFLQQEMREIQKELGGGGGTDEFLDLEEEIEKAKMPEEVTQKAMNELNKLRRTPSISPEATVLRNYLDWLVALPWNKRSKDNLSVKNVQRVLDEDHYGLDKPKERILEHISVMKLKGEVKGQVICFVGPPGVGKTSLARSIGRALGRKLVRISLGGVRDEAEIRGHRRTYVGALPGRIIQQIKRAGTKNPVFLMDEIDKMGADFRGDPQAALMEVLDPEVNNAFQDHYLEVDFDLTEVFFITTANTIQGIPKPLLDRMEVIPLRGYLDYEKLEIAARFLVPKKLKESGLTTKQVRFDRRALLRIIREYTREAGVREVERQIGSVVRKAARAFVEDEKPRRITASQIESYLGVPRYRKREAKQVLPAGVVHGLAWTEAGGEILKIEVSKMKGKGELELTGQLGDVMKESAKAAISFVRTNHALFHLKADFFEMIDLHVHVPEGAIPKDGPSAGVAIEAGIISAVTGLPVPGDAAMTGEITLSGDVIAVGGLEEKILAAKRSGLKKVFIPRDNERDIKEMKKEITEDMEILYVRTLADLNRYLFPKKELKNLSMAQTRSPARA
jgi:ATP-dependent Lon protease